jgi:NAD-dependent dihydropyrimidine dehydrogenase PreA subunit
MFEITVDAKKCNGCAKCVDTCPKGPKLWKIENDKATVMDVNFCINCAACAAMCPTGAIKIKFR